MIEFIISGDPQGFLWSSPINLKINDQFVRIPFVGDVKVSVINSTHTTLVLIESVSQVKVIINAPKNNKFFII